MIAVTTFFIDPSPQQPWMRGLKNPTYTVQVGLVQGLSIQNPLLKTGKNSGMSWEVPSWIRDGMRNTSQINHAISVCPEQKSVPGHWHSIHVEG